MLQVIVLTEREIIVLQGVLELTETEFLQYSILSESEHLAVGP